MCYLGKWGTKVILLIKDYSNFLEIEGKVIMKLLFIHYAKTKLDDRGNIYTDGSYNSSVWSRYLSISNNLTVMLRRERKIYEKRFAEEKFNYFNSNKIRFIELEDVADGFNSMLSIKKQIKLRKSIKSEVKKADLLIIRLPSVSGDIAIKYAKKYRKPYIVEVVGCVWDSLWNYNLKGKILAPFRYASTKKSILNAPYAMYVTNEFLQNRYPCNGKTVACSDVLLPALDESVLQNRISKIKNMEKNKPIILGTTAAVDVLYKGQEVVIKAISRLNKQGFNFEYYLVGSGDNTYLRSKADENGVADKVKFLGSLPHSEVFKYLDNIDIYVQPSLTEGLPRALVEAMSRGCTSLGTNVGGIPELISNDYLFSKESVDELVNILKNITSKHLISESIRNFNIAKGYQKELIDKKRNNFYLKVLSETGLNTTNVHKNLV